MKKIKNIFEWLDEISLHKTPIKDIDEDSWEKWNSYMIHRFISMKIEFIEVVNYLQKFSPQGKKELYKMYCDLIPKKKTYFRYIKSTTKLPNKDLTEKLSFYFGVSTKEAGDYNLLLDRTEKINILQSLGLNDKEIKPLLK